MISKMMNHLNAGEERMSTSNNDITDASLATSCGANSYFWHDVSLAGKCCYCHAHLHLPPIGVTSMLICSNGDQIVHTYHGSPSIGGPELLICAIACQWIIVFQGFLTSYTEKAKTDR